MTELAPPPAESAEKTGVTQIGHWIGGEIVLGRSGRSGPVYEPATGRQAAEVAFASPEEVDAAVAAAKEAFPAWRALSLSRRADLMFTVRELVHTRREEIARILTREHGKVLSDALGEVARGLEVIEYCCGLPTLLKGGFSEQASTGIDVYSLRQPLGVVAGITPFNFPAMVPMWMWAPALASGNCFVLKPSEKDPSASMYVAELLHEAGVPDGVFNVVHGDKVAVDSLLGHPDIAAVSFVGSTPIARYIYETGTANGKRVQALGGAKNHMIVLPDADIEMAADAAVSAGYGSAGERCMAVSVVVVVGGAGGPLVDAIKERLPKIKVGNGFEPGVEMGPLITREHRDKVAGYLESGAEQGATVVADGRDLAPEGGLLPRAVTARRCAAGDGRLPGRDLRPGALRRPRRHVRRGAAARQREPVRQRDGDLHARRRRREAIPVRGQRRHGRDQRPDSGAGRVLLVRRLEGVAVRRSARVRARRDPVLHAREGRHQPLAGPRDELGRPRLPADALTHPSLLVKATLLLADFAQVADGKLTVVGGGWSVTGPEPTPFAIAILVQVPWDQANVRHTLRLELIDADGHQVTIETEDGEEEPIVFFDDLVFEVGRPPGLKPGTPLDFPVAVNSGPLPLEPGGRYEWRLSIDGRSDEDWRLPFTTRDDDEIE